MSANKIKVLFISSWFQSRVKPFSSQFVHRHAEAASLYADITVLHVCFDNNLKGNKFEIVEETIDDINVIYIYIKKPFIFFYKIFLYLKAYKKGINFVSQKFGKADIVHANVLFPVGIVFLFLKSFKKMDVVFTEHWSGYLPDNPSKIGFIKKYLIKKISGKSSYILPVSENLKNAMINMGFKGNYRVIPNVVNTKMFSGHLKRTSSFKKILHISSLLDNPKNISGILRVIKKLSDSRNDFSLHFITNGYIAPFIELAKRLSILNKYVFFDGGKKNEEIAEIMHLSDFLLLFSNYENLPCVILEALSCDLPVIATKVGDIPRYITEKYGILVKPRDEEGLLKAIENMLDHFEKFDRSSMHAFAEKNFSYEVVGKEFYDIYSEVLKSNL